MIKYPAKLFVSLMFLLAIPACTEVKTVEDSIVEAKVSITNGHANEAIILLKNAVRMEPKNADVRFLLGEVYLNIGDYKSAEKEFEKSIELASVKAFLYSNLLEAKVKQFNSDEVEYLVDAAKGTSAEEYNKVLTYAGISYLHEGDIEKAKDYINQANEVGSHFVYSTIGKAYLANTPEQIESSIRLINAIVQESPSFADAWLAKGFLLQGQRKALDAAESFEEYSQLRPKDVPVLFFIAQNYLTAGQSEKASSIINRLIGPFENNAYVNQMKGQLEFDNKNYALAQEYSEKAYQLNSQLLSASIVAGLSSYHLKELEQAYKYLIRVQNYVPSTHLVNKVLAELQLRLGYIDEATITLDELIKNGAINEEFIVSASQELVKQGKISAAQDLLQTSIDLSPQNASVMREKGLIKLKMNDIASGIDILEKSLALDPNAHETEEGLASAYLSNDQLDKAMVLAKRWQESDDKKVMGLILESTVLEKSSKSKQAKALLNEALTLDANSIPALYKLAIYEHKEGNIEQAFKYFTRVLEVSPEQPLAIQSLISLAYKNVALSQKLELFLITQIKVHPESQGLKLAHSYLYASQSKFELAINILEEIKKSKSNTINVDMLEGDYYTQLHNWSSAISSYKAAALFAPTDHRATSKLIRVYEYSGDLKSALSVVDTEIIKMPNHYGLLLMQANYQSRLGIMPKQALISRLKTNETTKNHAVMFNTLGNIAVIQKNEVLAIEYFEQAYEKSPTSSNVFSLAQAYGRSKQFGLVTELLNQHLKTGSDYRLEAVLANAYLANKNYSEAEFHYLGLLEQKPKDLMTLNNLAVIQIELGKAESAHEYAKQALAQAPKNSAVIDTYGMALYANKQYSEALTYFEKALAIHPKNVDYAINKSRTLIALTEYKLAESVLLPLKASTPEQQKIIDTLLSENRKKGV